MAVHRVIRFFTTVLIITVLCSVAMGTGVLTAKAFYCRDPDTGKFYPVNSTWSSTTFCGSYTCKLRKLNHTVHTYPIREINITQNVSKERTSYVPATILKAVNKSKVVSLTRNYNKTITNLKDVSNSIPVKNAHLQESSKEMVKEKVTNFKKKNEKLKIIEGKSAEGSDEAIRTGTHQVTASHIGDITQKNKYEIHNEGPAVVAQKESEKNTVIHKNSKDSELIKETEQLKLSVTNDDDRYLTTDEIKALTSMLRNVKKSDLEAILEVYNLAQDIYKEIDKHSDHSLVDDIRTLQSRRGSKNHDDFPIKHETADQVSYWYEPLSHSNHKEKIVQMDTSNLVPVLAPEAKKETHTVPIPPIIIKKIKDEDGAVDVTNKISDPGVSTYSYFMGPLSSSNFGKLPYYFPIPSIQRHGIYVPPQEHYAQVPQPPIKIVPPSITLVNPNVIVPPSNTPVQIPSLIAEILPTAKSKIQVPCKQEHFQQTTGDDIYLKKTTKNKDKLSFMDDPKTLLAPFTRLHKKAPTALPYPFAYVHYNLSSLPDTYLNVQPFQLFNVRSQEPLHQKTQLPPLPYINPKYVSNVPNAILINPDLSEEVEHIIEQKPLETEKDKMPTWQTAPLSPSVINEVKANIVSKKLLPIPIRKKVKLERVSKVIKMDDLKRAKRDTLKREILAGKQVTEEFEVYLEKSTCTIDTEPGFFKMGNITQPYPACCPQRIR